ncbi:hypothetical protein OSTOST_20591, partial [Ostertagia ostertagi]
IDTNTISSSLLVRKVYQLLAQNLVLILRQPKNVFLDKPEDENSEQPFSPPVYALTWSAKCSAQYIVGVNAAGGAVIWDLQRSIDTPQVLLDSTWSSPVTAASFIGPYEVALAFRERLVRVYDVRSYECSLEENAVRTAGSRVTSQPRLFSGFFAFQSEYFATGDIPTNGVSFICTETKSGGYFVVPLGNRHGLMTWDVAASSVNATVASCGVDGRLALYTILEETLQHLWLDISLNSDPQASRTRLEYSALDLRIESLNCVATNHAARLGFVIMIYLLFVLPFVFTGGQAGLMFIRPCVMDTEV